MSAHYDALETRDPEARERAILERLPRQVAHAKAHAPAFAKLSKKRQKEIEAAAT